MTKESVMKEAMKDLRRAVTNEETDGGGGEGCDRRILEGWE